LTYAPSQSEDYFCFHLLEVATVSFVG